MSSSDGVLDLFEMVVGANNKSRLMKFRFESDKVAAEIVRLRLVRRSTTGTGGAAGVVAKNEEESGSATTAVNFDVTSPGTIGAIHQAYQWEQLGPLEEIFLPEERLLADDGTRLCLEAVAGFTTDSSISGYVVWREE